MKTNTITLAFLALLACTALAGAIADSFATLNCAFSSPSRTILAKGTYYSNNLPTCGAMTLVATLPNSTKVTYPAKNCSTGVHEFVVGAPVNGVYSFNATVSGYSATCSSAALFFESRPRLPETNWAIVVLTALSALAIARKSSASNKA